MCGLPTETDEDVAADRRPGQEGHQGRPRGHRAAATSAARSRSAGSCPSRTRRSSGPASSTTRRPTRGSRSCATRSASDRSTARRSASATTTASPGIVEGLLSRGDRRVGAVIQRGLGRRRPVRRLERALLATTAGCAAPRRRWPTSRSTSTGTPRASASRPRSCPGTTSTPASTRTGSGRTGRTRSPASRSRTAAGRRASTAASARRWAPRSRSARPGKTLLPLTVVGRRPRAAS